MGGAVYNAAIPNMVNRALGVALGRSPFPQITFLVVFLMLGSLRRGLAADWSGPEQQLARKIVAVTGPGAVAVTIENHSSLGRRDTDIVSNGLRAALEALGIRSVKPEQAAATVAISLSENPQSYVWVAEIRQGAGEPAVVMVASPLTEGPAAHADSVPLSIRKIPLWTQEEPILDVAVLEESASPVYIGVLDAEKVSLYHWLGGKWQQEQALPLQHSRPWPRDLRGRLVPAKDHLLDAYLPGVFCRTTAAAPLTLSCRESDDPWPLLVGSLGAGAKENFPSFGASNSVAANVPQMSAFFGPTRNFFTGALAPGVGKFTTVPKFYSAAFLPREKYVLWLFAAVDGSVHMVDGITDMTAKLGWGSNVASVRTSCGAGWQVLATSPEDQAEDSIRAFEFPDREPVPVSAAVDFSGEITALWTEAKGDTAIAVSRNRQTGSYEAFRLAMACGQ
jgi:hypothetical protein